MNKKQSKQDHEARMTWTDRDEFYYKKPKPLTDKEKEWLLHEQERIKRLYEERSKNDDLFRLKMYEQTASRHDR